MLGLLLARAGVNVAVLEKHGDFLRDFRGDTIHPSTLEILRELGILDAFLARPHQEMQGLVGRFLGRPMPMADFSHLPVACRFIALMPQWEFLDFLAEQARRYPSFHLRMNAEVTGLVEDGGRIAGVIVKTPDGEERIAADLVIGADGRHSIVRERAGLQVIDLGAPMDVLWLRLSRHEGDPTQAFGVFEQGRIFVMLYRGDYWQCGFVIAKGRFDDWRRGDIGELRRAIAGVVPWLADRVNELKDWNDVKLLTVRVDRLREWARPGLLCIGDAAHAMSPVGGIGINLAIQDAVATANLLAGCLRAGACSLQDLRRVQKRREWPTRVTQWVQLAIQNNVVQPALAGTATAPPLMVSMLRWFPVLRRIPGWFIGMGIRPEHVKPV
jgi:2-polyprenyl-6-methoxyphenol hydroxylase-like FAD-dependent oxidoreductase